MVKWSLFIVGCVFIFFGIQVFFIELVRFMRIGWIGVAIILFGIFLMIKSFTLEKKQREKKKKEEIQRQKEQFLREKQWEKELEIENAENN